MQQGCFKYVCRPPFRAVVAHSQERLFILQI
jgi:hypothetical protein